MVFTSQANKKYQSLKRQVHAWKAKDHLKDKELEIKDIFPHCRGTFDNCPKEEDITSLLEKKQAPSVCGKCPVFQEKPPKGITAVKESLMTPENEEFYRKFMKK